MSKQHQEACKWSETRLALRYTIKRIVNGIHAPKHIAIVSVIYLLSSLTDTTSPPSSEEKKEMEKLCNW